MEEEEKKGTERSGKDLAEEVESEKPSKEFYKAIGADVEIYRTREDWVKECMLVSDSPEQMEQMEQMKRVMEREIDRWANLQANYDAWGLLDNTIDAKNDIT